MMKIVIKIPENIFKKIEQHEVYPYDVDVICDAILSGIPLPKGHGNLIQREDAEAIFKNARRALLEQSRKEKINDLQTRELMLLNAEQFVHLIQPIIEADKEGTDAEQPTE